MVELLLLDHRDTEKLDLVLSPTSSIILSYVLPVAAFCSWEHRKESSLRPTGYRKSHFISLSPIEGSPSFYRVEVGLLVTWWGRTRRTHARSCTSPPTWPAAAERSMSGPYQLTTAAMVRDVPWDRAVVGKALLPREFWWWLCLVRRRPSVVPKI
jgi:hypothetical protein